MLPGKYQEDFNRAFSIFLAAISSGAETLEEYYSKHPSSNNISIHKISCTAQKVISELNNSLDDVTYKQYVKFIEMYLKLIPSSKIKLPETTTEEDTDDRAQIFYEKDSEGKIQKYKYRVFRKNREPIEGSFTRDEMNLIYKNYSCYGSNLTRRTIARSFPNLSLTDFKRILTAFNITKDCSPFAPHMMEEHDIDELREIHSREKENNLLKKLEEDRIRDNENYVRKLWRENEDLKDQLNNLTNIKVDLPEIEPYIPKISINSDQSINLYLADMHLGAFTVPNSLYSENKNYGKEECERRLKAIIDKVKQLGQFEYINVILMGDNIDCCGHFGKTYKLTHEMPENIQPRQQVKDCTELIVWFVESLYKSDICEKMNIMSVPEGNHTGPIEYTMNVAIMEIIKKMFPEIRTTIWEEFFGVFYFKSQTFICMHGRDPQFMKKGFPLELNDNTKARIMDWITEHHISGNNIHVIKGDLHSSNVNTCQRFTYRNVLSLFGASDYSNMNYGRNSYGISYDIIKGTLGEFLLRGEFRNI